MNSYQVQLASQVAWIEASTYATDEEAAVEKVKNDLSETLEQFARDFADDLYRGTGTPNLSRYRFDRVRKVKSVGPVAYCGKHGSTIRRMQQL